MKCLPSRPSRPAAQAAHSPRTPFSMIFCEALSWSYPWGWYRPQLSRVRSAAFVDFADLVPSRALSGAFAVSLTTDPASRSLSPLPQPSSCPNCISAKIFAWHLCKIESSVYRPRPLEPTKPQGLVASQNGQICPLTNTVMREMLVTLPLGLTAWEDIGELTVLNWHKSWEFPLIPDICFSINCLIF